MSKVIAGVLGLVLVAGCGGAGSPPGASSQDPTPGATPTASGPIAHGFFPASGLAEIRAVNLDGSQDRKLIDYSLGLNHADWSPDGRKIAVVAYMDNRYETWSIFVFDADGRNPVRVTQELGTAHSEPAWSLDGTRLLFSRIAFRPNDQFDSELWLVNADGGNPRLVVADGFAGKWHPDGTRIIYSSNKTGNHEIYTAALDGSGEQRLTDTSADESYPAWSPDGRQIVFCRSTGVWNSAASQPTREIFTMNADGTGARQLTENRAPDGNARWSPDGSQLVFSSDRAEPERYDVYVMNADGTDVRQVTHVPSGTRALSPVWRSTP